MKKRSILVVDGEKNIRSTMQKSLETEGTSVFTAVNAEEALETLQRNPFDLVFLDLNVHSTPITIVNRLIDKRDFSR